MTVAKTNKTTSGKIDEARRTLELFHAAGSVVEVRILGIPGRGKPHGAAGYFDDFQAAAKTVIQFDNVRQPKGIYCVLNRCDSALLARSPNTITEYLDTTTSDSDIQRRQWLPVDVDPTRPAGISSTAHELEATRQVADVVREWLGGQSFSEPVEAMSGNGVHLLYPLDLPNDDETTKLVDRVLKVLDQRFTNEEAQIDKTTFNAARIMRLYGTTARKGQITADRPHRRSRLTFVPDYLGYREFKPQDAVGIEWLQAVASMMQDDQQSKSHISYSYGLNIRGTSSNGSDRLNVDEWLTDRGYEFTVKTFNDGRTAYLLNRCPFDENHGSNGEVYVAQAPNGALSAACKHNSCNGRGWQQFKQAIGPPEPHHYDPPLSTSNRHESRQDSDGQQDTTDERQPRVTFTRISCAELDSTDYDLRYLVDGILVDQQPCLIAGPQKSLKTNLLIDLAISLAAGGKFLGYFNVPAPVRIGIMSGESGLATLRETARRITTAAGRHLRQLDNLVWTPDLPIFGHPKYMDALQRFLVDDGLQVVVCDPAYLCTPLAADKGNNLFAIGELLRSVNDVCHGCGCTLLIAHHTKKTGMGYTPPELSDAAWSGWAEWARQWLLLNRREPFNPDSNGEHKLWFSVGGSAGHAGLWGLDITEGRRTDPGGRTWRVELQTANEVRAAQKDGKQAERDEKREAKFEADCGLAIRKLSAEPDGLTKTSLRNRCQFSSERIGRVIETLLEDERIEPCKVTVSNHKRPMAGLKLIKDDDENTLL